MSAASDSMAGLSSVKRALVEIKQMRARLDAQEQARREPVAIVGMGCRFPGGAVDPESFWQLLNAGVDAVSEIPAERWDVGAFYSAEPEAPGKMYTRWGAFLADVDRFDPQFFGISPREAQTMDPQQRLLLEVSWEALESAALRPDRLSGSQSGVFVGIMNSDYLHLQRKLGSAGDIDAYTVTGSLFSVAAGRLSYALGLQGPNVSVDTACSSSLVAIHLACQSLRGGECDLALAGGVNLILLPEPLIERCKARMLSFDGRCKTFDAAADGYVAGEGCGMLVLKRLSDALAGGDRIFALIRGSSVNHDGPSSGLTVPNGPAQQALLRRALANAGIEPAEIGYVEAHGTGTFLGDPIEVNALNAVFGQRRPDRRLAIGSVKTNIGHLESAAGVAGVIKTVLALQHEELPPHLHFKHPNPHIAWGEMAVTVPTERTPWPAGDEPRFAGVSSFAVSGTNAHLILAEAPAPAIAETGAEDAERPLHLLTLSARSAEALAQQAARVHHHLAAGPAVPLPDQAYTANVGRTPFSHRLAVVGASASAMAASLAAFAADEATSAVLAGQARAAGPPKVAFLFTGQGSQYVGMGRLLYDTQPSFRRDLERCDEILRPILRQPLLAVLFPPPGAASPLDETAYTQPALFALEVALAGLWQSWGIVPDVVLGHSLGEYTAACVAGVFSLEDGLKLVAERARLMQELPPDGKMAAVFAAEERVAAAIGGDAAMVATAAVNAPEETVISGAGAPFAAVCARLRAQGIKVRPLTGSHAFHSPLMDPMLPDFARAASELVYTVPDVALASGLTGSLAGEEIGHAGYWVRQTRQTVRFAAAVRAAHAQGCRCFVEIGPSRTLLAMARRCLPEDGAVWLLPSLRQGQDDWQTILRSLAALYVHGAEVDWSGFDDGRPRRRVALPTYPFQRERHWFRGGDGEAQHRGADAAGANEERSAHPLLGSRLPSPLSASLFASRLALASSPLLAGHRVAGVAILPAAACLEMALAGAEKTLGPGPHTLDDVSFVAPLALAEREPRAVQTILTPEGAAAGFQVFAREVAQGAGEPSWRLHAAGRVRRSAGEPFRFSLDEARARCPRELPTGAFYRRWHDRGLEYGSAFQGIERLWHGVGEALGRVRLPPPEQGEAPAYGWHPALLDACLQVALAALGGDGERHAAPLFLPTGLASLRLLGTAGEGLWSHAAVTSPSGSQEREPGFATVDLHLFDELGRAVAEIRELTLRRTSGEALLRAAAPLQSGWLYDLEWQTVLQPRAGLAVLRVPGTWLIFADRSGVGTRLAELLTAQGESCRTVFAADRAADLADLLREAAPAGLPPWRGVVHLWSLDAGALPAADAITADGLMDLQVTGCGSVLDLLQGLAWAGGSPPPRLWLVTRGAQHVPGEVAPLALAQSPVWGLGRGIASEAPEMWGGLVDLGSEGGIDDAAALLAEVWQGEGGEDEVALRGAQRYALRLVRSRQGSGAAAAAPRPGPLFQDGGTHLITGGLGALGLQLARWLVEQGARHLVLIGRRAPADPALQALGQMAAMGAEVLAVQADVTCHDELAAVVARIDSGLPPLRGVFHAAGILADGVLQQQEWSRFREVMSPKLAGAWNLHLLTRHRRLDCFVLFSSIASLLGPAGQANYAAANSFLDALAEHRREQGLPALSVNWGPWADTGMAAALGERERQRLAAQGLTAIPSEQGLQALAGALRSSAVQVAVLAVDWAKYLPQLPSGRQRSLLAALAREGPPLQRTAVLPATAAAELVRQLRQTPAVEARQQLAVHAHKQVAEVLGLNPANPLDPRQSLFELGMDSLTALEIKNRFQNSLGCQVPAGLLLDRPSLDGLVDYLAINLQEQAS